MSCDRVLSLSVLSTKLHETYFPLNSTCCYGNREINVSVRFHAFGLLSTRGRRVGDLRSAVHLHRVTSLWEVLVAEPGAVRSQVESSAGKVPLLKKGHLKATEKYCTDPKWMRHTWIYIWFLADRSFSVSWVLLPWLVVSHRALPSNQCYLHILPHGQIIVLFI